jgi:CheY-like chemotaxis protein/HPt (histidine-containing phosphotransfer) domain-containing protein
LTKPVRRLELHRRIAESLRKTVSAAAEPTRAPSPVRGRVLLAEDNPVNQAVAQNMIEAIGCDLSIVANGAQAVEALAASHFDLVLMDCQMPEMDGYAATVAIRAAEARRSASGGASDGRVAHIPIIALTAHAMASDREASFAAGMDDHLSKPFSLDGLRAMLQRWMPASCAEPPTPAGRPEASGAAIEDNPALPVRLDQSRMEALRSMKSAGPDLVERVVRLFLETTPGIMARLRLAASSGDAQEIGRAAHSLRGSARELGALRFAQLCEDLEVPIRTGKPIDASSILTELEREYEWARRLLTEQIEPAPTGTSRSAAGPDPSLEQGPPA